MARFTTRSGKQYIATLLMRVVLVLVLTLVCIALAQQGIAQSKHTVSGIVTDTEGAVLANAIIRMRCGVQESETGTDPNGRFEIDARSQNPCEISISAHGFKAESRFLGRIRNDTNLSNVVLKLEVPHSRRSEPTDFGSIYYLPNHPKTEVHLEGEVTISPPTINESSILPQVAVLISRDGKTDVLASVHLDGHGRFEFAGLKPGRYVLRASLKGHPDAQSKPFVVTDEGLTHVNLVIGEVHGVYM